MKKTLILLFYVLWLPFFLTALPSSDGYFTDTTGSLQELDAEIEALCAELEAQNTCELAVLVVQHMGGLTIEEFANEVFNTWGVGQRGADNGVLFVLAIDERKARIETGYGVEHILPDSLAGNFLLEYAVPSFKENNWLKGVQSVSKALAAYLTEYYVEGEISAEDTEFIDIVDTIDAKVKGPEIHGGYYIVHLIVIAGIFIFNIVLAGRHKFLRFFILGPELLLAAFFYVFPLFLPVNKDTDYLLFAAIVAAGVFLIQYFMSRRHHCPTCKKYMTIRSTVVSPASYSSTGRRRIDYKCTACDYKNTRHEVIPRLTRSTSSGSSWSSSSSYSSGSSYSGSSSSSSFGGGSSGGGGASVGF
ncbi:MAG: TPM domain-containing protein [Spirochaetales bacterium]|nr:TPM domain-containing protein [Spirochaetales bacterium]